MSHWSPVSTRSIRRWKVAGALARPKGMTLNWNRPLVVQNADFSLAASVSPTCQYPLAKSRVEKYLALPRDSRLSSMRGRG